MWRNTARSTGANESALGAPRRWGNSTMAGSSAPPPPPSFGPPGGHGGGFGGRGDMHDRRGDDRFSQDRDRGFGDRDRDRGGGFGGGRELSRHGDFGSPSPALNVPQMKVTPAIAAAIEEAKKKKAEEEAKKAMEEATATNGDTTKKRKSRFSAAKVETDGMPTAIISRVPKTELESYAFSVRLEEINRKLRMGDYVPDERDRSPSPPPTYDHHGKRTNTREVRYRKKLEDERIRLVEKAMRNDPMFRPPAEYLAARRGGRPQEKVFIPVKEFPEINFFGLLVGPRGNSLKKMERDSGAKISIRGRGSVKEGKTRPDHLWGGDDDEDLHCLVVADTEEKVRRCVELINGVIETAASTNENDNDHKRTQLRELAMLNGTLRDDENQVCQNCGNVGHRKYDCPEQRNFTANIICRVCGQAGHMARDCTQRRNQQPGGMPGGMHGGMAGMPPGMGDHQAMGGAPNAGGDQRFDSDYASLMAELGEMPVGDDANPSQGPMSTSSVPPWRNPANWHPPQTPAHMRPANAGYNTYQTMGVGSMYGAAAGYSQQYAGGYPQMQAV